MSEVRTRAGAPPVTIRPYRPSDHHAGRRLWAELTGHHQEIYGEAGTGGESDTGADAGAAFEEYLTRLDLSGVWVADHPEAGVIGLVGLILRGRGGEVEPIVVDAGYRRRGIGHALLDEVAGQARRRGMAELTVSPRARDIEAVRCFHAAGYTTLSSLTFTLDIDGARRPSRGIDMYGLRFSY
ncbi:MAG TPA: GNAT family N-acetyltransferase [Micromonosporaceae bacterium]